MAPHWHCEVSGGEWGWAVVACHDEGLVRWLTHWPPLCYAPGCVLRHTSFLHHFELSQMLPNVVTPSSFDKGIFHVSKHLRVDASVLCCSTVEGYWEETVPTVPIRWYLALDRGWVCWVCWWICSFYSSLCYHVCIRCLSIPSWIKTTNPSRHGNVSPDDGFMSRNL
jgi:hypothetical protein